MARRIVPSENTRRLPGGMLHSILEYFNWLVIGKRGHFPSPGLIPVGKAVAAKIDLSSLRCNSVHLQMLLEDWEYSYEQQADKRDQLP